MTKSEAREIYHMQMAIAQTFRRDIFDLCERKGIPEEWVLEFVEDDHTLDRFLARHTPGGTLRDRADRPRGEFLKDVVRAGLMGQGGDRSN